jgi:hypothetical protein
LGIELYVRFLPGSHDASHNKRGVAYAVFRIADEVVAQANIVGIMRKPWLLFLPIAVFALLSVACWVGSFYLSTPQEQVFKNNWMLFSQMGSTFQGLGTLFVALVVGVSFVTYSIQLDQFALQQTQAKETSSQLLETTRLQSENLKIRERQAATDLLIAKVHSLTSRIQGYEAQIAMVRATVTGSMMAERRTEEDQGVKRMRSEQHHLYLQLDSILNGLKIGTMDEIPPEETYADPFGENGPSPA